jgi:hypothetical protein
MRSASARAEPSSRRGALSSATASELQRLGTLEEAEPVVPRRRRHRRIDRPPGLSRIKFTFFAELI